MKIVVPELDAKNPIEEANEQYENVDVQMHQLTSTNYKL